MWLWIENLIIITIKIIFSQLLIMYTIENKIRIFRKSQIAIKRPKTENLLCLDTTTTRYNKKRENPMILNCVNLKAGSFKFDFS